MAGYYFTVGGQRRSKGHISRCYKVLGTIIDVKNGSWTEFMPKYFFYYYIIYKATKNSILTIALWNNLLLYVHNSINGWRKYENEYMNMNEGRFI